MSSPVDAKDITQVGKLLRIDTILPKTGSFDPLLLTMVSGSEGISKPFSFDVTMYRPNQLDDLGPGALINTPVTLGIQPQEKDDPFFIKRKGVFEHFERSPGDIRGYRVYIGRIVPAFKMLARETVFRVFQDKNVKEILEEVFKDFPNLKTNTKLLESDKFPKLEYCVQFGENSLAFVTRMMAVFGIWYVFDHELDPDSPNETMVLGRSSISQFNLKVAGVLDLTAERAEEGKISGFMRSYDPAPNNIRVRNFNPLQPRVPIESEIGVRDEYDLLSGDKKPDVSRFKIDTFPAPLLTFDGKKEYADDRINEEQVQVYSVSGNSRNRNFRAGLPFVIGDDDPSDSDDKQKDLQSQTNQKRPEEVSKKYLVTYLSLLGSENGYHRSVGDTIIDFFKDMFKSVGTGENEDVIVSITNGMLNNYLQSELQLDWYKIFPGGDRPSTPGFVPLALAGTVASVAGILPSIIASIKHVADQHGSGYSNSFKAVPWNPMAVSLPLPVSAPKPVAYGPHLAVVIGDDGAETSKADLSIDVLGRVRVRFPWESGSADQARRPAARSVQDRG